MLTLVRRIQRLEFSSSSDNVESSPPVTELGAQTGVLRVGEVVQHVSFSMEYDTVDLCFDAEHRIDSLGECLGTVDNEEHTPADRTPRSASSGPTHRD